MLDIVRTSLHRAITTPFGDRFLAVRLSKDLARRMNAMLGEPLCSEAELQRRRAGRARLEELKELRKTGGRASGDSAARGDSDASADSAASAAPAVQAPVMIYFEKDRNVRMLRRIQELLDAKSIRYTLLDVTDDETTKDFVLREAKCHLDDLPIVFVATTAVGGYNALVDWDVSGRLAKALAGA
jgi:glutaredoxin